MAPALASSAGSAVSLLLSASLFDNKVNSMSVLNNHSPNKVRSRFENIANNDAGSFVKSFPY
jgi:hypothetical protein